MITIPIWLLVGALMCAALAGVAVMAACVGAHRGDELARWALMREGLRAVTLAAIPALVAHSDAQPGDVIAHVALTRGQCEAIIGALEWDNG